MKFKNLSIYTLIINLSFGFFSTVMANEINESQVFKLPTNTDTLNQNQNAQLLLSEEGEILEIEETEETQETQPLNQTTQEQKQNTTVEYTLTPLQVVPVEALTIQTANMLPTGGIVINYGANVFGTGSQGEGTGLQVYNGSIDYGISPNWQVSLDASFFDDILSSKINGKTTDFGFTAIAPSVKYKLIEGRSYNLAVVGSVEWVKLISKSLFNNIDNSDNDQTFAGTIQVPLTYDLTENAQWHIVGGVTFFPDSINDSDFYGTFFNIGTGVNIKVGEQLSVFADVNVPLGPGGNSISKNEDIVRDIVWSAGLNYLHSPTVGVDLSITNRLGTTPASQLLTFVPGGGEIAAGLNIKYTPSFGKNYASSFANNLPALSDREKQLLFDGITLVSPYTIRQGMFSLDAGIASGINLQIGYGLSDDAQFELIGQQLADSDSGVGNAFKRGVSTKLRFLNQNTGSPFSFSLRGAVEGTQSSSGDGDTVGAFIADAAFSYEANENIAFMFNPKAGLFGDNRIFGAGLGINFQAFPGLQLIGEVTPMVSNDPTVWAAGARYMPPRSNIGLGVYGTNAAGTGNIGSVVTESDDNLSVGFNIMLLLGGN